ncbi:MAG TPA: PsbP-related protein [Spirochaetota bacterium]|nr:PsbP-related protein [Spirochaetota bacterium]HPC39557.1 PsbP-related protein [Spirochaetota bacterium]HPL15276.1 PsbP-related protein [Spirochaetota bacterium]HQF06894.1 PsbP-related protein [Spirochaetota bacterium]HQH95487.1 PsbP-related protein [Spirochaetota bacterium]
MKQYLKHGVTPFLMTMSLSSVMGLCVIMGAAYGCSKGHDRRYVCGDARFSISFPETWKTKENLKGTRILAEIPDEEGSSVIRQNVNVVVEEIAKPVSLNGYVEQQKIGLQKLRGVKILTAGETTVDGSPAKWLTYSYTIRDFGYQALVYVLNRDERYYVITGLCQINAFHKHKERFHSIAKSFRFE